MESLRLYVDVARCHSFSQAATLHGITQSAVSQRIGQLEKRLGVRLLDRSSRPLALTEAGQLFLTGAEDILERFERLEGRISAISDPSLGYVQVAAIYSAGIDLLQQVVQAFSTRHPRVRVEIVYQRPDEVYRRVLDRECDLGLVSYPQRWRKVEVLPLREEVMVVVCHPGHPLAGHSRLHAADLSSYEMITFDTDLPAGRRIRQYLKDHGATPRIVHCFDNIDTLKTAAAVTDRFSILPRRTVRKEVEAGTLRAIELQPHLTRPIGIIFRPRGKNEGAFSPATQTFVDFLFEYAGPGQDRSGTDFPGAFPGALPGAGVPPDAGVPPAFAVTSVATIPTEPALASNASTVSLEPTFAGAPNPVPAGLAATRSHPPGSGP